MERKGKRDIQGESKKKSKRGKTSTKANGKTILLILGVTCKPQSQLSKSSLSELYTKPINIFPCCNISPWKVIAPFLRKHLVILLGSFTLNYFLSVLSADCEENALRKGRCLP